MPQVARVTLRTIAAVGCVLLVALTAPNLSPTLLWKWPRPMLLQLLLALPAIWLLVAVLAAPKARSGFGMTALVAIALLGVAPLLATVAAPFPRFSFEFVPLGIGPILLFIAIGRAMAGPGEDNGAARRTARIVAGCLAALSLLSLVWWLVADVAGAMTRSHGQEPTIAYLLSLRNERPLGHSNYTAGVAVLALGWTGALAFMESGRTRRVWLVAAAVSLATLFSSGSRGGWLALASLAAMTAWLWMVRRGANRRRIAIGVIVVAVATIVLAIVHPRTRALIGNLADTGRLNPGDVQRFSMAQAAIRMAADRPLFGSGPGATPLVYPRYRGEVLGGVETALQLHSTPLQILADTGVIGLAGAILIVALVGLRLRRESRDHELTISGCASVAFLGYAVFSLTDFQLDIPAISAAVAATAALSLREDRGVRIPGAAVLVTALVWLGAVAWSQRGAFEERARFSAAIDALEHSDFAAFRTTILGNIGKRTPPDPIMDSAALILADPHAYRVDAKPEPATAIALLDASLVQNPDQEIAHFNLGWLLLKVDPAKAESHFREAARLVPDKGGVYLGLATSLLEQGRGDDGLRALAAELANDPMFCASPLWSMPRYVQARAGALQLAADECVRLAPGDPRAARVASVFRWLAGDDSQPPPAPGIGRSDFSPPMNSATIERRQRTAYPLLMRNSDIPPPIDLEPVVFNADAVRRLSGLLPPKGWLSGPQLRKLGSTIPE